ncbi:unnamed protein product [Gongylonema pulchrum]|uniref:MPHOSPH9 n=1 Tax=Gongylonema pulchrum TaxID=637853 RepID=A0A183DX43_9BILA|nr:unnamed protein product [Gongylonema pulchrum]
MEQSDDEETDKRHTRPLAEKDQEAHSERTIKRNEKKTPAQSGRIYSNESTAHSGRIHLQQPTTVSAQSERIRLNQTPAITAQSERIISTSTTAIQLTAQSERPISKKRTLPDETTEAKSVKASDYQKLENLTAQSERITSKSDFTNVRSGRITSINTTELSTSSTKPEISGIPSISSIVAHGPIIGCNPPVYYTVVQVFRDVANCALSPGQSPALRDTVPVLMISNQDSEIEY